MAGGRRLSAEQRRAELVRAATAVFAERGYRGTSLAAVAERVGITAQGVLHHFRTKDALLLAVLEERERDLGGAAAAAGGTADRLRYVVTRMLAEPGIPQSLCVLSADSVTEGHPAQGFFRARYERLRTRLADGLRAEFGDTVPGGLGPEAAAVLLVAVLDGVRLQWLLDPTAVDLAAAVDDAVRLLLERG
ncbi:TetR/AcrR family transcriptional regulator [Vallicoccus soli]|uniref:TetR/AcrR family transcriptional regulator n=1 Tax=Vallicoccus soli TaxID=2339232 RepID=A0A3A3YRA8_9ACTN|nr:TetR/AcrR family transcriptional regulator [Vallicoccus soli]RJK93845.1 TetR/AcrR family transcriptional regulator [Vallicoccus soli]